MSSAARSRDVIVLAFPGERVVFRLSRSALAVTGVASALALVVAGVSMTIGEYPVALGDVVPILLGDGTLIERDVVVNGRLPRVLTGLAVGAAFALSGAILQRVAANPLVSPDVIGINAGAAVGALLVLTVLGRGGVLLVVGALVGAVVTALLVLLIAFKRGLPASRLVLVGIGVGAALTSAISYLLTRADINEAMSAAAWLTGSLANRRFLHVLTIGGALVVTSAALVVLARNLRLLELGDELACALSGRRHRHRVALVLIAVALAATATAAAGPIGFVALVAPQIVRRILAERQVGLVPAAAVGALLVVSADLAARVTFAPLEMPVGAFTAVLGAPVLLYLLARAQRIGRAG